MTPSDTLDIGDVDSFLDEPVMGNILIGSQFYYYGVKNLHLPHMGASHLSKAFTEMDVNLLSPQYNHQNIMPSLEIV